MDQRFEKLVKDSEEWYRLGSEKGDLKKLLSGLYPDKAHFVYELIQNADDAKAKNIYITLFDTKIEIKHDGSKKIDFNDIKAITGFSISNKDENEKIGKFGIGFKSVYMFTDKPEIISDDYHFSIRHMVIPQIIDEKKRTSGETIFILPFNSPNKTKESCYTEILTELKALEYTCLLFLPHIENIHIEDKVSGWKNRFFSTEDDKISHLVKLHSNSPQDGSQTDFFLVYKKDIFWETNKKFLVSVAFPISFEDDKIKLETELEGQTYIFFPAINANSNLQFHINAPFASTPDRSSILDNDDNHILMEKLGETVCDAILDFKEKNLIGKDLFEILPNQNDSIKEQYEIIRDKIINFFQEEEIIPLNAGGYGKYSDVYTTSNDIRELIPDSFAHKIFQTPKEQVWIKNFGSNSRRAATFYENIEIKPIFKNDAFVEVLDNFKELLAFNNKNNTWLKRFYEVIYSYKNNINPHRYYYSMNKGDEKVFNKIKESPVFLGKDGNYHLSEELFFSAKNSQAEIQYEKIEDLIFIDDLIFDVFENETTILESYGFQLFDEDKTIELRIKTELENISKETLFVLFEKFPKVISKCADVIKSKEIFFCADGNFHTSETVLVPHKYCGIDFSQYYNDELFPEVGYSELDNFYFDKIEQEKRKDFISFLNKLGVVKEIPVREVEPRSNPNWQIIRNQLTWSSRGNVTEHDYGVDKIEEFFKTPNKKKSYLVLHELNNNWSASYHTTAKARWADSHPWGTADSTLLYWIKESSWIPQKNDTFVKPADAKKELTPEPFLEMSAGWFSKLFFFENNDDETELNETFIKKAKKYLEQGFDIEKALEIGINKLKSERGF